LTYLKNIYNFPNFEARAQIQTHANETLCSSWPARPSARGLRDHLDSSWWLL